MRLLLCIVAGLWLLEGGTGTCAAQDNGTVNIYRFVLGVDVPESPALVAIGVAPTHVLRASAPKPISLSVLETLVPGGDAAPNGAIDVAPYFFLGGGVRTLASYRSMSIAGRLTRVLTKTILSIGAARDPADPATAFIGLGIRSTFHDPHDVLGPPLPEAVAAELAKAGVPAPSNTEEEVGDRDVDLEPLFAHTRRALRSPSANPQVSGGWGVAGRLRGSVLNKDSSDTARHCFWLGAQFTPGRRFDLLTTVELRDAFHSGRYWWIGAGLQRKSAVTDVQAEVYYDTAVHALHPGVAVDARASSHVGIVGSVTTQSSTLAGRGPRKLAVRTLVRWFYASDR